MAYQRIEVFKARHIAIFEANAALLPATIERVSVGSLQVQFITDGPDIPDSLLRAHEEGRVVFFCGAGISYPAGLPGFEGLVKEVYRLNGTALSDSEIEHAAFRHGQFDAAPYPLRASPSWRNQRG